jgi:phosphate transport system permease protein
MSMETSRSQPPSGVQRWVDSAFIGLCQGAAWVAVLLVVVIVLRITIAAAPAMRKYGVDFILGTTWDPNKGQFSILPEIWGTLYSSLLALVGGTAFGVAAAVFLSEAILASSFTA